MSSATDPSIAVSKKWLFSSWIPTIAGRLSYSYIGLSKLPTPCISINKSDSKHRYIIAYQKRFLNDPKIKLLDILPTRITGRRGKCWCVCTAKSDNDIDSSDDGQLKGNLYIFIGQNTWRGVTEDRVKQAQELLKATNPELNLFDEQEIKQAKLVICLIQSCSYYCEFILQRNGIVRLSPGLLGSIPGNAPNLPNEDLSLFNEIQLDICSELFYFLKDISHHHQHHSPTTDTMVGLYKTEDDQYWPTQVMRVIFHRILAFKRSNDSNVYISAIGLLSYVESFISICNKDNIPVKIEWNTDQIKQSINVSIERLKFLYNSRKEVSTFLTGIVFAIVSFIISFVQLNSLIFDGQFKIDASDALIIRSFAYYTIINPEIVLLLVVTGSVFDVLYTNRINLLEFTLFRFITRLLFVFKKRTAATIMFILAIVFAYITYLVSLK